MTHSLRCAQQVIANMTVGKDVSTLFTDVVNCIQTGESLAWLCRSRARL